MTGLLMSLLISQNLFAKAFGGTNDDKVYSVSQTTDGGCVIAGCTQSFGAGSWDFLVLKLNPDGSLTWAKTFGGVNDECLYSIVQTTDGGYIVAGWSQNFGTGEDDLLVLKLKPNGDLVWAKTFGGMEYSVIRDISVSQTTDGGCVVGGLIWSFGTGVTDFLVLKLNSNGSLAWARTFGGTSYDLAFSVSQTTDGGYVVAGRTNSFGAGSYDFLVLKLNPDGSLAWARSFGGTGTDYAWSVSQTTDGGYVVAGRTYSFGAGEMDFLVLKLNPDGNYPGCVQACSPTVMTVSPSTSSPSVGATCSPSTSSPSPTVRIPIPSITDVCPSAIEEINLSGPRPGITCSPVPGGALFLSPEAMAIKIYAADGRVAYSGNLDKGENRISLEAGVYLWQARYYRGKAAIR